MRLLPRPGWPITSAPMSTEPMDVLIDAALEIVDADGWGAVSQRRLAAATNYGKSTVEYHWRSAAHFHQYDFH